MSVDHAHAAPSERSRYRRTNLILLVALLAYLAVALERERVPGRPEFFPVGAWSLFSMVPNDTQDYGVRLLEVRGQPLAHPLFLEDAAQIYPFASTSHA